MRLDSQLIVNGIVSLQPLAVADDDNDVIYNMEISVRLVISFTLYINNLFFLMLVLLSSSFFRLCFLSF